MKPFDGKYQNLQMSPRHFYTSSYRFRDLNILNVYLQKVVQGHAVQLRHSMTNVKIYKRHFLHV